MPADSMLDSAPEDAVRQPAAEPSEAPLALSSEEHGLPEAPALGEPDGAGRAAPTDGLYLDHGVLPPLDHDVLVTGVGKSPPDGLDRHRAVLPAAVDSVARSSAVHTLGLPEWRRLGDNRRELA